MFRLSFILNFLLISFLFTQTSPHGNNLKYQCEDCHTEISWNILSSSMKFNHDLTGFRLTGQHKTVECKSCHTSLKFEEAKNDCKSCHQDIHQNTVGVDCQRCHNSESWLVKNIKEIHNQSRLPLIGVHQNVNCQSCHSSFKNLLFEILNTDCYSCHKNDYETAKNPDHKAANFSTDCTECHSFETKGWGGRNFSHSFFPLSGGHEIKNCYACHSQQTFSGLDRKCVSCHLNHFEQTKNPDHRLLGFSINCENCHKITTWKDATFDHDNSFFPIYSGKHRGKWNNCGDCHSNSSNYSEFSCINCHEHNKTKMDSEHRNINGYVYSSQACLNCHPTGSEEGAFRHDITQFALTGSHINLDCSSCHTTGFTNTPTECQACHIDDFNQTQNPNHQQIGMSNQCNNCHTTQSWTPSTFNHSNTNFPLTGAHTQTNCASCHQGQTTGTPTVCFSCHQNDYNQTTNPNHSQLGFPTNCDQCHSTQAWQPASFNHDNTQFPLTGAHTNVSCNNCHQNGFENTPTECQACHIDDFNQTQNPNHQQIGMSNQCNNCHTTQSWTPSTFNHSNTNFPLTGAHTQTNCASCHQGQTTGTPTVCFSCHQNDYNQTTNPNHSQLGFPTNCDQCHSTQAWQPASFNHDNTQFPLTGAHTNVSCNNCHQNGFENTPTECQACHIDDFNQTQNPNHQQIGMSNQCNNCHTTQSWTPSTFNHSNTNFPLTGAHTQTNCASCHQGQTTGTSTDCFSCHQNDYNQTTNPNHSQLGFPTNCDQCHSTQAWQPASFDHDNLFFPIYSGKHKNKWNNCTDCHNTGNYSQFSCINCHEHNKTKMDQEHRNVSGYVYESSACLNCHPNGNADGAFNHNQTGFPLTGVHSNLLCSNCHTNGFPNTPTECFACHQDDYEQTTNPNHQSLNLSTNCQDCHNTVNPGWTPAQFPNHNNFFELTGAHLNLNCNNCHNGNFNSISSECQACHIDDFNQTQNPNHQQIGMSNQCNNCHTTQSWTPSTFNHSNTNFPLTGAHTQTNCASCHQGQTTGTPTVCFSCHQNDYNQTTNPNHSQLGFPTNCDQCHSTQAWQPASFDHDNTQFPLTGAHTNVSCNNCHQNGFENTPTECQACHIDDFNQTQNPNHQQIGMSNQCNNCHTTQSWSPSTFNHSNTNFPLTGAHTQTNCASCHQGQTTGTSTDCYVCHQNQFNQSTNPSHTALNLPTNCTQCHTTNPQWKPALFPIHNNFYPLTGQHNAIRNNCVACHNGNYNNTPNECQGCHMNDFNGTTNPNHVALQFPHQCDMCHTTNGWSPSTFNHDQQYFPIFSGKHRNKWANCSICHTNPNNFQVFSCITCHEHNQIAMNQEHQGVPGYVYNSQACYNCHPNGDDDFLRHQKF